MDFHGWTIEHGDDLIPFENKDLQKVVFLGKRHDWDGTMIQVCLRLDASQNVMVETMDYSVVLLGDKRLRLISRAWDYEADEPFFANQESKEAWEALDEVAKNDMESLSFR